jgi:putative hemolysin
MSTPLSPPADPFALPVGPKTCLARAAHVAARPVLSRVLGLEALRRLYERIGDAPHQTFEARVLAQLDVRIRVHASESPAVPADGPLIVAANHPTGALDGLVLIEAIRQVRSDVRLLANHLLSRIPELAESCFFVDPFAAAGAPGRSLAGMRAAHLWLRRGGAVIVFPAGEVAWEQDASTDADDRTRTPLDSPWQASIGRLALSTRARVLPVHLEGRNSRLFYVAGRVHPRLRTALLGRELLRQRNATVHVHLAPPISPDQIGAATTPLAATALIRAQADSASPSVRTGACAIAPPIDRTMLHHEISTLPADAALLASGAYDVLCAGAAAIPLALQEIGRLRELTFREVGEGTGKARDLDRFDDHYQHLFVWNRQAREIVGAYRIGATDRILPAQGVDGLYTATLFRYDAPILQRLTPALELGRSFVRAEYQRSYTGLLLLWKGLGQIVACAPRYRVLFGPVSISSRYHDTSQRLLRAFLAKHHRESNSLALVEGVHSPGRFVTPDRDLAAPVDIDDLDAAIRKLEGGTGMPVLLRQYLRLDATLLGFNVDPAFGEALDALMMVDLTRVQRPVLQRYLGVAGAARFLARHSDPERSDAAA